MSARWRLSGHDFRLGKLARHSAMFFAGLAVAALEKVPDVDMGKWTPVIGVVAAFAAHTISQAMTKEAEPPKPESPNAEPTY